MQKKGLLDLKPYETSEKRNPLRQQSFDRFKEEIASELPDSVRINSIDSRHGSTWDGYREWIGVQVESEGWEYKLIRKVMIRDGKLDMAKFWQKVAEVAEHARAVDQRIEEYRQREKLEHIEIEQVQASLDARTDCAKVEEIRGDGQIKVVFTVTREQLDAMAEALEGVKA
jgi:hypothetical protein